MLTSSVTTFIRQGYTAVDSGSVMTCFRQGNANVSSTCDLGGSGSGSNYANTICVRFDDLPSHEVNSASVVLTFEGWDYRAALSMYVQGCADFKSTHNGTSLPTMYGSTVTGSIPESSYTSTELDVTAQINAAIAQGSKCLYISANKANNRKTGCKSIVLTYNRTCTITYNANGGSGAPAAQTYETASSGTTTLSSTEPTKSGYAFLGWSLSSTATSASYSAGQAWSLSNNGDYTLYAVWGSNGNTGKALWNVGYASVGEGFGKNNYNWVIDSSGNLVYGSLTAGGTVKTPTRFDFNGITYPGYTLTGWQCGASSGSTFYGSVMSPGVEYPAENFPHYSASDKNISNMNNVTSYVYSKWTANTGVAYWNTRYGEVGDGYTLNTSGWVYDSNGIIATPLSYGSTITTPSESDFGGITKFGYTLAGWKPGPITNDASITESALWGELLLPGTTYDCTKFPSRNGQHLTVENNHNFVSYMFAVWKPHGRLHMEEEGEIRKVRLYTYIDGEMKPIVLYVGGSNNTPKLLVE